MKKRVIGTILTVAAIAITVVAELSSDSLRQSDNELPIGTASALNTSTGKPQLHKSNTTSKKTDTKDTKPQGNDDQNLSEIVPSSAHEFEMPSQDTVTIARTNDIDPYGHLFDALAIYSDKPDLGTDEFTNKLSSHYDPDIESREVTCREGLCRLRLSFYSPESRDRFSENIDNVLLSNHAKEIWHLPAQGTEYRSVVYIAYHEQVIPTDDSRVHF